ncbi:hypothetical protein BJF90_44805 [Pseudonocardia sp. CNS-004]|nr:hypothetical protein BJF90_44805 [Pseudonocardia sp. CNS-004]
MSASSMIRLVRSMTSAPVVEPFSLRSLRSPNPTVEVISRSPSSMSPPSRVNTREYPPLDPCSHTMRLFTPLSRQVSNWAVSSSVQSSRIAALATRNPNSVDGVPLTRIWLPCTATVVCVRLGPGAAAGADAGAARPVRSVVPHAAVSTTRTSAPQSSPRVAREVGRIPGSGTLER